MTKPKPTPAKPARKRINKAEIAAHLRRAMKMQVGWDPFRLSYSPHFVEHALESVERLAPKDQLKTRVTLSILQGGYEVEVYRGVRVISCGPEYGPLRHRIACAVAVATGFPADKIELPTKGKGKKGVKK